MEAHICKEDKTCSCDIMAVEPNQNCPEHGWPYPPRCSCGRFVKDTRRTQCLET